VRRINEAPACELCGNWTTRGRALCARCDVALDLCRRAPKRPPREAPVRVAEPEPVVERVVARAESQPVECGTCGERKVFDVRLHVCREDRRTA
jgi:hypothetical protein